MDTNIEKQTTNGSQKVVLIERKSAFDFESLKKKVLADHWRKFTVEIQIREKMHGGKPVSLDAAKAMLKARGLEDIVEAREAEIPSEERAVTVVDEGLCAFHRREGKPGLWWPSNNFKACVKENWSVLGYNMDARPKSKRPSSKGEKTEGASPEKATDDGKALRGSRGALHEGLFVVSTNPNDLDWIYLGEQPDGIDQNVSHTTGPKGPQSSIKRNEYFWRPKFTVELWIARAIAQKIPDETLVDVLLHAQEHGVGANRSQGMGKFDVVSCTEI
jgi:hypothetical protein